MARSSPTDSGCPSDETLQAFLDGDASGGAVGAHAQECSACARVVALLAPRVGSLASARSVPVVGDAVALAPGASVGRYIVLHEVGRGGMGVVHAAYDPELDRKIALKVVRAPSVAGADRLLAEARALARVAHASVIAVHDVGRHGDGVYLAMELVAGPTLATWAAQGRSRARIIEAYVEAARGLAAAHRAGLVHGDFKPQNALIGPDGRVVVVDFGLACSIGEVAGAPAGTPAYMAPEQRSGGVIDARVDQYSFCVALAEALTGARPENGTLAPGPRLPRRLRRALERGLSADPAARYPSMDALLAALRPGRLARPALLLVATTLLLGLAAVLAWPRGAAPAVCTGAGRLTDQVWNDARRDEVARAFAQASPRIGADAAGRAAALLDEYVRRWQEAHTAACRATRVYGEQSEAQLGLRNACLERRRRQLDALIGRLTRADQDAVLAAVDAVGALPRPADCDDVDALAERAPLPPGVAEREAVARLDAQLAGARASAELGHLETAQQEIVGVLGSLEGVRHQPLHAEIHLLAARVAASRDELTVAATAYDRAIEAATRGRDDHVLAEAWLGLAWLRGYFLGEFDAAARALRFADAVIERAGAAELRAVLLRNRGWLAVRQGRLDEAVRDYERALRDAEALGLRRQVATLRGDLGAAHLAAGRLDAAEAEIRAADATLVALLGEAHPDVFTVRNNLGSLAVARGEMDRAEAIFTANLAGFRAVTGDDGVKVGQTLFNLATVAGDRGDLDVAADRYRRAADVLAEALGPAHVDVARALEGLGTVHHDAGRHAEAEAVYRRALAAKTAALGPAHASVGMTLANLGNVLRGRDDAAARDHLRRALDILRAQLAPGHPHVVYVEKALAEVEGR